MPRSKKVEVKEEVKPEMKAKAVEEKKPQFYKGYDIKWLRNEVNHPDFGLVAEYDKLYGKVK